MAVQIKIVSESWGSPQGVQRRTGPTLRLVTSNLFAREIIAQKVRQDFRANPPSNAEPLSIPQSELANFLDATGPLPKDEEEAVQLALQGFARGAFLFFWNDNQIDDLDQILPEGNENEALFVKLVPLAGG